MNKRSFIIQERQFIYRKPSWRLKVKVKLLKWTAGYLIPAHCFLKVFFLPAPSLESTSNIPKSKMVALPSFKSTERGKKVQGKSC